jgi:hypothetical protein
MSRLSSIPATTILTREYALSPKLLSALRSCWLDEPDLFFRNDGNRPTESLLPPASTWTRERYESPTVVAKRCGTWPFTYGPIDRIPADLIDNELKVIISVAQTESSRRLNGVHPDQGGTPKNE